jgi:hypothetical protein
MKNVVIRLVFALTLLLALGAVVGGVTSGTAHAATITPHPITYITLTHPKASKGVTSRTAHAATITPYINTTNCDGRSDLFQVYYYYKGEWCVANAGYLPATIPNTSTICSGNNEGIFYTVEYGNTLFTPWYCYYFSTGVVTFLGVAIY